MKLLIFGGNGFIGGECVRYLLDQEGQSYDITVANRGHWAWDNAVRIKPHVKNIYFDRLNVESFENLKLDLDKNHYDAIIDFSATSVDRVRSVYPILKGHVSLYIYISSDSVYEVCEKDPGSAYSKEEDAVRPADPNKRTALAQADPYGNGKLEVEEFLQKEQKENGGIPYIFLRPPDVLGPRDTTDRWWKYQMWFQYHSDLQVPVIVPKFLQNFQTSYVNTIDLAELLRTILTCSELPNLHNRIYNVAFDESMSLYELLKIIRRESKREDVPIEIVNGNEENFKFPAVMESATGSLKIGGDFYFPSVTRGPIDVTKVTKDFRWEPTKILETTKPIAEFYDKAYRMFPNERNSVAESLLKDLQGKISDECKRNFLNSLSLL